MLKVLVVDDDRLARQGIIAVMPWAAFDMEVVGEANSGERALEILQDQHVDLLITDLAMPAMSGLDLIRGVRTDYPHIWNVVLTFHQDFGLIQEALRLGAIDYIAKTQMEQAKMEDVLERIASRIQQELSQRTLRSSGSMDAWESNVQASLITSGKTREAAICRELLVFIALEESVRLGQPRECPLWNREQLYEVSYGIWAVENPGKDVDVPMDKQDLIMELERNGLNQGWMILHITDRQLTEHELLRRFLSAYREIHLFYDYRADMVLYTPPVERIHDRHPGWTDQEIDLLREKWSSLFWVLDDEIFESMLEELEHFRLPLPQLKTVFYAARMNWQRIVPDELSEKLQPPGSQAYWMDWMEWLKTVRSLLGNKIGKSGYFDEIQHGVMKALAYIDRNIGSDIRHSDLANEAMMSKGYFSRCFKNIVGKPFHDYIRDARMEHAMVLLEQTANPIFRIAEQCGYPNEKYFSRVFRAQTGMLPSEFRSFKARG
ncbi:response regulator transcription factor [Paenibacillus eucommiae]|uniref:Two-component system response regulator YesN n=1 Tax=Paenibacillus eucommiae TaxID=1355755 RepID=A0ABS4IRX4_9BACL|nr:helix-turn-helix domain-containing protein [Paenibacillus eucommiae]MBP1990315.1 two-component system response regulator YesN [Paenibacillus eucommiae]